MTTRRTDSAFPLSHNKETEEIINGLTKRELFSVLLMQSLTGSDIQFEDIYQKARMAVMEADALIAILDSE